MLISTGPEDILLIGQPLNHRINQLQQSQCNIRLITQKLPIVSTVTIPVIDKLYETADLETTRYDRIFVTLPSSEIHTMQKIYHDCKTLKIPINITDHGELSTFTVLNSYDHDNLKIGISTSGKGCRLSSKIKRHMIASLPTNINQIIENVSLIRNQIKTIDNVETIEDEDEDGIDNSLVKEFEMSDDDLKQRRSRWLNQIIEYYPLEKLSDITLDDLEVTKSSNPDKVIQNVNNPIKKKGTISLVGAGPGSPDLLTTKALNEILSADLILSDKLVPSEVLDLVPKKTPIFIAKKYPGNAEQAQIELLEKGLEGVNNGLKVVRLKQGDPYIFGRGGEEFKFFNDHDVKITVVPGITSALSAPMIANIPVTHREVADQVLICTGTGRRGALPNLPEFVKSRTTIFLMTLHRSRDFVQALQANGWPMDLPSVIVERANCIDERVTRCELGEVPDTMDKIGSRPPGLLVTGYACDILADLPNLLNHPKNHLLEVNQDIHDIQVA